MPPVKKNAPALTIPQVQVLLCSLLPRPVFDVQSVLAMVTYWQHRNPAAYVSHRKRRLARLHSLVEGSL
jgi:hypothetical protein